jgi:hypothetical protein
VGIEGDLISVRDLLSEQSSELRFYKSYSIKERKLIGSVPLNDVENCEVATESFNEKDRQTVIVENLKKDDLSKKLFKRMRKLELWVVNLLQSDKRCHSIGLMISKPLQVFCLDINGKESSIKFTKNDVKQMIFPASVSAVDRLTAISWCRQSAKKSLNFPRTFTTKSQNGGSNKLTGKAVATIEFSAKNAFGVTTDLQMKCVYEGTKIVSEELLSRE